MLSRPPLEAPKKIKKKTRRKFRTFLRVVGKPGGNTKRKFRTLRVPRRGVREKEQNMIFAPFACGLGNSGEKSKISALSRASLGARAASWCLGFRLVRLLCLLASSTVGGLIVVIWADPVQMMSDFCSLLIDWWLARLARRRRFLGSRTHPRAHACPGAQRSRAQRRVPRKTRECSFLRSCSRSGRRSHVRVGGLMHALEGVH